MDFHRDLLPPDLPANQPNDQRASGTLNWGDNLYSATRAFRLTLQKNDGNLVLYTLNDNALPFGGDVNVNDPNFANWSTVPVWQSGMANTGVHHCDMQNDGNFVMKKADGTPVRAFGGAGATAFLRCQDDGNVVLYTLDGHVRWSSGTSAIR